MPVNMPYLQAVMWLDLAFHMPGQGELAAAVPAVTEFMLDAGAKDMLPAEVFAAVMAHASCLSCLFMQERP